MPELFKNSFKKEISLVGSLSSEEVREKWKLTADNQKNTTTADDSENITSDYTLRTIGKPFCGFSVNGGKYYMHYHSSYKKDFCDTMFEGEIFANDETCQLQGIVKAAPGMKNFANIFLLCCIVIGVFYFFFPFFGYPLYGSLLSFLIGTAVAFLTLKVDANKLESVMDNLQHFINSN